MNTRFFILFSTLTFLIMIFQNCTNPKPEFSEDVHSFSNPNDVVVKHIDLDLNVDFANKIISGNAVLTIENKTGARELLLDSRGLNIIDAFIDDAQSTNFKLGESVEFLGQPLSVRIKSNTKKVTIEYETTAGAAALQWLEPPQTADGIAPFLFTQSQAIHARSWIPCQDTPGVRFSYSAKIKTEPGLLALMSAENPTKKTIDGVYEIKMTQPIPSYLLALTVGDLEFQTLGERSGIYAEPSVINKAAKEFEDTEKMIAAAEKLYGPYQWERYDMIVLPPSFPYGGMENPRLTFLTPTVLAGDKSLVSIIAHELAHSWSGNLVTNANWNDFWINEGFTTYLEHRIMEELYGKDYADMLASLGYQDMVKAMKILGYDSSDTHLQMNLKDRDPDEWEAGIPYDKGHFLLRTIEAKLGREKWDSFVNEYFKKYAFKTMTSDKFISYFESQISDKALLDSLNIQAWIYGPGIPKNIVKVESDAFTKVEAQIETWGEGMPASKLETDNWTTHQWLHFLRNLPKGMNRDQMAELEEWFGFTETGNSEIKHEWLLRVIENQYEPAYPAIEAFLTSMGRRKFLKPIYKKMYEQPEMVAFAKFIYQKARSKYHPISVDTIDRILEWQG